MAARLRRLSAKEVREIKKAQRDRWNKWKASQRGKRQATVAEKDRTTQKRRHDLQPPENETHKLQRIQFDLDSRLIAQLDLLRQETGCGTRRELLTSMIVSFQWAVEESSKGRYIASFERSGEQGWIIAEKWMLSILESVRRNSEIQHPEQTKR